MLGLFSFFQRIRKRPPVFAAVVSVVFIGALYIGHDVYKTTKLYIETKTARAERLSVLEVLKTKHQRTLDDLALLFPDAFQSSKECYQAALSNYIEDHWNRLAGEYGCFSDARLCEKGSKESLIAQANQQRYLENPVPEQILIESTNAAMLVGALSKYTQPLYVFFKEGIPKDVIVDYNEARALPQKQIPDPLSFIQPPQDKKFAPEEVQSRVKELNRYVESCQKIEPLPWVSIGKAVSPSTVAASTMKLGEYAKLLSSMVGQKLTTSENKVIQCLLTLNEVKTRLVECEAGTACATTPPQDTKEDLLGQLDELIKYDCSLAHAIKMTDKNPSSAPASFELKY